MAADRNIQILDNGNVLYPPIPPNTARRTCLCAISLNRGRANRDKSLPFRGSRTEDGSTRRCNLDFARRTLYTKRADNDQKNSQ